MLRNHTKRHGTFQGAGEIYPVSCHMVVEPGNPLYVGNFYRDATRIHRRVMADRQNMILYLAAVHQSAVRSRMPLAFCRIPMSLVKLRKWVYDYRIIFDHFFEVADCGYNFSDQLKDISIVIPKPLVNATLTEHLVNAHMVYQVPDLPDTGVVSKTYIQFENAEMIRDRLARESRFDLIAPVEWLLTHPTSELNVWFSPAGKLQMRDTSTWPIKALETWPSWLRVAMFGKGVDIESAYMQYIVNILQEQYAGKERLFQSLFPELIQCISDKHAWRKTLCEEIGLEFTEENNKVIKSVCMALANGAKISESVMIGNSSFSSIKEILDVVLGEASLEERARAGKRLGKISREFTNAKRIVCLVETKRYPSRTNQKAVFRSYFSWEREARYQIWHAIGEFGVMVHDGIDGIPEFALEKAQHALDTLPLRIS